MTFHEYIYLLMDIGYKFCNGYSMHNSACIKDLRVVRLLEM